MYRDGTKLFQWRQNIIMDWGGLGDMIARMPAIRYVYDNHPQVVNYVFVYDYMLDLFKLSFKNYDSQRLCTMPRSALPGWKERHPTMPTLDFTPTQMSSAKPHLTEYGFNMLEFRAPEKGPAWNYLQPDLTNVDVSGYNLPERYGVLCTGYTARVREWPAKEAWDVADWMVQNNITPVYLGKRQNTLGVDDMVSKAKLSTDAIHPDGIDLLGNTDLVQALKILSKAQFVAGPDCGLLHLASMSDVPTVWGFTSVAPETRLPWRHGIQGWRALTVGQPKSLQCRYCQTRQNYVFTPRGRQFDYKWCFYDDYVCTKNLTAGAFIAKIKEIIGYKGPGARMGK